MLIRKRAVLPAAVLMLLAGVQAQYGVTLPTKSFCAVTGITVIIPCTITKPRGSHVADRGWYRVQSSKGETRHLSEDPQYSRRVSFQSWSSENCQMTVSNVRASDTGVYNFRFKTRNSNWISASTGVQLTVTDLQVKVDPNTEGWREVNVTCSSTCRLNAPMFIWYRNGYTLKSTKDAAIVLDSRSLNDEGSYSCSMYNRNHRSPSVCVLGEKCWGVTYTPERVCALQGTSIDLSCSYKHPAGLTLINSVWFVEKQVGVEPLDVREVEEYRGRVQSIENDCKLKIANLTQRDAQTYRFRFHTDDPTGRYTGEPGVSLSVTGLQVTESTDYYTSSKRLNCTTTCTLSNNPTYIWYKNGEQVYNQNNENPDLRVSDWNAGSYSCAVRGQEDLRSPAVCIFDVKHCWSVTYPTQTICSLIGSSVDIPSYFTFPNYYKVTNMIWFVGKQTDTETVGLKADKEYQDRVQYTHNLQNHCKLTITNLREKDTQTYRFRFYTDDPAGKYTGESGVFLSVTGLKVTVSDYGYKTLSCTTTCTLSNNSSYIWYKNGEQVPKQNSKEMHVNNVGAGSYSCAVRGQEDLRSPAVYPPRNTTAVLRSSGDTVEGDSVTLSCRTDANPTVLTYTWFKQTAAADTLMTTGQNYSISNVSSQHRGLYYCTALNQLGRHNSTPTHLDVLYSPKNTTAVLLSSGDTVEGDSLTLTCSSDANPTVLTYTWFMQRVAADTLMTTGQNYSISNVSSQHSGLYYCTALNQLGRHNSTPTRLDVLYPPRNLSVTVVPSVSGDSITLLCTSDSNPVSSYTWHRKTIDGVMLIGNGTNLTLSSREDGFHYCTARNGFGSTNSSEWAQTSDNRAVKYVASGITVALVLISISLFLWMRRRKPALRIRSKENSELYSDVTKDSAPVYGNISALTSDSTQIASSEDQDDVQYTSVYFRPSPIQEGPLYSTVQLLVALKQEEDEVEYATVSLVKSRAVREDEIYSNLNC